MQEIHLGANALLVVLIAVAWQLYRKYQHDRKYRMPPALPGYPILGSWLDFPTVNQRLWAIENAKKYGEMFTCKVGSDNWVFLNSSRVVIDLLEKRSAIYSSRPRYPMTSDIVSGGCRMLIMPYGDRWRKIRKIMHIVLNKTKSGTFEPYQDLESRQLVYDYLHRPDKWFIANQRFANSVIMSVVFGKRFELGHPHTTELLENSRDFLFNLRPGGNLVDIFHWLDNLPVFLKWWVPRGKRTFRESVRIYKREIDELQQKVEDGTAKDCYALRFLQDPETKELGEIQTAFALGSMIEAGSDTTRVAIAHVLAAAATDHRWVKTAQAQLDDICGKDADRLPTFADRPRLPYITAVAKEGVRWRPQPPIGVPRVLTRDDEYEGYRFPAGTVFTWNAWHLTLSPDEFDDPERFWPERFLDDDLNEPLKGHWNFGVGRRVCGGYNVADANLWIAVARILYCFKIEAVDDQPIDTLDAPYGSILSAPFSVRISARSQQHAALIDREGEPAVLVKY